MAVLTAGTAESPTAGASAAACPAGTVKAFVGGKGVCLKTNQRFAAPQARIAFVSSRDGNDDVFTMNVDGSGTLRMTRSPASDYNPVWSPDGRKVVFLRGTNDNEIWVMNADGSGKRNLSRNRAHDFSPVWSPNGQKIAFISSRDGDYTDAGNSNGEIYVMNADGSGQRNLTRNRANDISPAWSPNGQKIAFVSDRNGAPDYYANGGIYVMNADGRGQRKLTRSLWDESPSWSPDGKRITFVSTRDSFHGDDGSPGGPLDPIDLPHEIYVMNADGSRQRNLTRNPAFDVSPVWSPNGRQIAFSSSRDVCPTLFCEVPDISEIYLMNANGGGQRNLTQNPKRDDLSPAWSPDGRRITFVSARDGNSEIYVMNADGSRKRNLTDTKGNDGSPAWSPAPRRKG